MFAGVASVVTHALTVKRRTGGATRPPWGDGFVGRPLATLWYPRSWSEVSDDELVLFLPQLTECDDPQFGIAARLRESFIRRTRVSEELAALSGARAAALRGKPLTVEERATVNRLPFDGDRPQWAREAAILDAIGHMLRRAHGEFEDAPSLEIALLASIHTGINASYVYPEHAYAHELLAAGAWLGVLLKGRRAIMPEAVAGIFDESEGRAQPSIIDEMLHLHMDCLGGRKFYVRQAWKVIQAKRYATGVDIAP
jgi:hypothetical protein